MQVCFLGLSNSLTISNSFKNFYKAGLAFVLVMFVFTGAYAQFNTDDVGFGEPVSDYGIKFDIGADAPLGNLKGFYRAGSVFDVSVVRNMGNFVFGAGLGYREFPALNHLQSYVVDDGSGSTSAVATATYQTYSSIILMASGAYNFPLNRRSALSLGLNAGRYFSSYGYSITSSDATYSEEGSVRGEALSYVAPKAGVAFNMANNVQLGIEARYNVFFTPFSISYSTQSGATSTSGTAYSSFATSVSLTYRFP